jgi:hypothetical protein
VILRTAGLEQFRHARQTTGDVLGLGAFQRDTGENVARLTLAPARPTGSRQPTEGSGLRRHGASLAISPSLSLITMAGLQIGTARGRTPVDDRRLVMPVASSVPPNRDAVDDIFEFDGAFDFGHDRAGIRVPLGQTLPRLTLSPSSTQIFEP